MFEMYRLKTVHNRVVVQRRIYWRRFVKIKFSFDL